MKKILTLYILYSLCHGMNGQSFDSETLHFHQITYVSSSGLTTEYDALLRINNRNGENYSQVYIPFTKGDKVSDIEAGVIDSQGRVVRKLKNSEIQTISAVPDFALYADDFVKKFELSHNVYPYLVYFKYKINYARFIEIADWQPFLYATLPCREASLEVNVQEGYPVKFFQRDAEVQVDTLDNAIRYSWRGSFEGRQKGEAFAPPVEETAPIVKVVPVNFNFGAKGSFNSWVEFGNWIDDLNKGLNNLPDLEKAQINLLIKGVADPKEITRILYHYLQDRTRYINVSLDIGGLKPYPAEYVAKNKYGDCKALTNYMKAMLEYAGISSNYSLIYGGENPVRPVNNFPASYFNHVILMVPFSQDTVWLECTNNVCPFGYLGSFTSGRPALVVERNKSRFITTPALSEADNQVTRTCHIRIDETGASSSDLRYKLNGESFDYFNQVSEFLNDVDKEKYVRKHIPFATFDLLDWSVEKPGREADHIHMYFKVKPVNFPKRYGRDIVLNGIGLDVPSFETPDKRKLPVWLNFPISLCDTTIYSVPGGVKRSDVPPDVSIASEYGEYSFHCSENDREITMIKKLVVYANEIPVENYIRFYDFINSVRAAESKSAMIINQ